MITTLVTAALATMGILILEAEAQTQPQPPISTNVCQLVNRPDAFNGKRVQFHARADSDGIEHTTLTEGHCRYGIAPIDGADDDAGVQAFEQAIFTKPYGTAFKKVTGIFSGRFEFHPGAVPRFVLRLEHVSELRVSRSGHF